MCYKEKIHQSTMNELVALKVIIEKTIGTLNVDKVEYPDLYNLKEDGYGFYVKLDTYIKNFGGK